MPHGIDGCCNNPQICGSDPQAPRDCNNDLEEWDFSWIGDTVLWPASATCTIC